jgi:outer membrane receptor protein involved in Fe transport
LGGFHHDIDDLIIQVNVGSTHGVPTTQYQTGASVQVNGMEASLRVPLPRRVALRCWYSFQAARLPGNRRLSNSPDHLGNVSALFPLPLGIEAGTELMVVGERDTREGKSLDPVVLLNLNLIKSLPQYNLDFAAGVYNAFDDDYSDPGGPQHLQDRIPQDGITFRLQVGYGF